MVDIQSATAEIKRGKKRRKKKQDENMKSASATQGGHNNSSVTDVYVSRYPGSPVYTAESGSAGRSRSLPRSVFRRSF